MDNPFWDIWIMITPSGQGYGMVTPSLRYRAKPVYLEHMSSITRTPGVCGGRACIAGHRVRVIDVVEWHEHQLMTPDEIVSHIPTITLSDVHTALPYYFDHIEEIHAEMRAEREFVDTFHAEHPSPLDEKVRHARLKEAS